MVFMMGEIVWLGNCVVMMADDGRLDFGRQN